MDDYFVHYLGCKKAYYYNTLYNVEPTASGKEECLFRIQKIDEYLLLVEVIERLPWEIQKQVEKEYEETMKSLAG
ncbi:MAG: hypothetical protein R3328_00100 [Planococcaceae bacterium]|nr:hypothetical protein [Planococcaceae bacterium]